MKMIGCNFKKKPWLAVLEFIMYGDLRDVLQTLAERKLEVKRLEYLVLCRQLAEAVAYLASKVTYWSENEGGER